MLTKETDFNLPEELIAQKPPDVRGDTRLLVVNRGNGNIEHKRYRDIPDYLEKNDLVVLNRTRVMKSRIFCTVKRSGKQVEVLFLGKVDHLANSQDHQTVFAKRPSVENSWYCLIGRAKDVKISDILVTSSGKTITVEKRLVNDPRFIVRGENIEEIINSDGLIPLPPYIKRKPVKADELRYNTVFGDQLGSAASPTASLNVTKDMIKEIQKRSAGIVYVDLNIGLGTFRPIDTEEIESYRIHKEWISVPPETAEAVNSCKGRIWAFGTTVVRTLESVVIANKKIQPETKETDLFIFPGYKFKVVDVLVTNFHMPRTSLIALVFAFGGTEIIQQAYQTAIAEKYHFLSYGDSMLIV